MRTSLALLVLALSDEDRNLEAGESRDDGQILEIAWSKPLGPGYSGIATAGDRIFTMYSDGEYDNLIAMDLESGEELWSYPVALTYRGHGGSSDGPSSTPVWSDNVVYALGPRGRLIAVDAGDGRLRWSKSVDMEFGATEPEWGFTTTPLVLDSILLVQVGGASGEAIVGLDKENGRVVWAMGEDSVAYQSPVRMTLGGRDQVVAVGNRFIHGVDPKSGQLLWKHEYAPDAREGSGAPVPIDGDRFLLPPSLDGGLWAGGALYRVSREGEAFAVEEIWRSDDLHYSHGAPVVRDDYLYGWNGSFLTCVDLESGAEVWKSRQPGGSALQLVDGRLVAIGRGGVVAVIEATSEGYREIDRISALRSASYTPPAFARDHLFVRDHHQIAALRMTSPDAIDRQTAESSPLMSGEFGEFVRRVRDAKNKAAEIDSFMAKQDGFPIIEGQSTVHFLYRGDATDVAISGTMVDKDEWASKEPMERIAGTDLFFKSFSLYPATQWEYQFTIDFVRTIPDPLNPLRATLSGTEYSRAVLPGWSPESHTEEPDGDRGHIDTFSFESEALQNEREVRIYLPPGYEEGLRRYPLLIVNEGIDALESGKMVYSLDNLVGTEVEPVIVAFIGTTGFYDTLNELAGKLSREYAIMLAEELVPHLDERYRMRPGRENRAVSGVTWGGQAALYTAMRYPHVFGKVAAQTVRLVPPQGDEVLAWMATLEGHEFQFFVDWNRFDYRKSDLISIDTRADSRKILELLEERGFTVDGGEVYGGPGWASLRDRTDDMLIALFPMHFGE